MKTKSQIKSRLQMIEVVMQDTLQKRQLSDTYGKKMELDTELAFLQTQQQLLKWILNIE